MFLKIWNYLRGYVTIEVSGFSVERFINLAAYKGIYIWDVERKPGCAVMKVSSKAFKLLDSCAEKTRCEIKALNKTGLPHLAYRYRHRKFLGLGLIFFIVALYFLSSFVWLVETEGNERIATYKITEFLAANGLKPGSFKFSVKEKELEKKLLDHFGDIAWINLEIHGTMAKVHLAETLPHQEIVDKTMPCDIVAAKEGLIVSMATSAGSPKVKPGDVVIPGDILVSGELLVGTPDTGFKPEYVHARSEIRAKMYYTITFDVPYSYTEKKFTGKSRANYSIIVVDKVFRIINRDSPYESYDKKTSRNQLRFGPSYPLPITVMKDEFLEFNPVTITRTPEQAEQYGSQLVTSRIIREFNIEADIIDKKIVYTHGENAVKVEALITTIERIDAERPLTPPSQLRPENAGEGTPAAPINNGGNSQ